MATSATAGSAVNPQTPIANVGNFYINGCRLSWVSTTTFNVTSGLCRDSTDTIDIIMGGSQYSSATNAGGEQGLNNPSSAGATVLVSVALNGAGGLDVGTIAASKEYSVFAIGDSRGFNAGSALITLTPVSTGAAAPAAPVPHLPLGYDCYRYIGSVSIDSSSHVRPFIQTGAQAVRTIWYDPGTGPSTAGVVIPSSATSSSTTYINAGLFATLIPQSALEVILNVAFTPNSAGNVVYFAPATVDNGTTASVGSMAALGAEVTGHPQTGVVRVPVSLPNATQQSGLTILNNVTALVASTSGSDSMVLLLNGYIDQL